jgi:hypothetical protein
MIPCAPFLSGHFATRMLRPQPIPRVALACVYYSLTHYIARKLHLLLARRGSVVSQHLLRSTYWWLPNSECIKSSSDACSLSRRQLQARQHYSLK